ncbi:MAG TPA: flavodoxin domain-containing protein [Burkholderiales bacterium]|nr:flavodoxin domain-containing protein [Burkholderiales bacterium]
MKAEDDSWSVARRDFLAVSARLVASMALAGAEVSRAAQVEFPEERCGEAQGSGRRVLVTYASKYGSTGGVADAIGKELCAGGLAADVRLIKNVGELSSFRAAVIGSPIYRGKWMPEAVDFLRTNGEALRRVPVALFLACMNLAQPTEAKRAEVSAYVDGILEGAPELGPVGFGTFAGALHYGKLSWLNRRILKSKGVPEGDFRDWNAIRAWAREPVRARFSR